MDPDQPASSAITENDDEQDLHCHAVYALLYDLVDVRVTHVHLLNKASEFVFAFW